MIMDIKECRLRIKALQKTIDQQHEKLAELKAEELAVGMSIENNLRMIDDYWHYIDGIIFPFNHGVNTIEPSSTKEELLATGDYAPVESDSIKFNNQPEELS